MRLAVLAQRRRAMAADVEERSQCARLVAYEQHRQTTHHARSDRSRCRHLVDDAGAHPIVLEDLCALAFVELGVAVCRRGQSLRLPDSRRVRDLSKCHGADITFARAVARAPTCARPARVAKRRATAVGRDHLRGACIAELPTAAERHVPRGGRGGRPVEPATAIPRAKRARRRHGPTTPSSADVARNGRSRGTSLYSAPSTSTFTKRRRPRRRRLPPVDGRHGRRPDASRSPAEARHALAQAGRPAAQLPRAGRRPQRHPLHGDVEARVQRHVGRQLVGRRWVGLVGHDACPARRGHEGHRVRSTPRRR